MILMSTYLTGQIPFKTVFLHGLVRDAEKQKMSKTKGNVIDPLEISAEYGTDALRFALIFSTAAGNDIPLSIEKIRGMKHFSNKLWNMARFIHMKEELLENKTVLHDETFTSLLEKATSEADKEWIKKTKEVVKEVSMHLDEYQFNLASQRVYEFAWHEFADVYIEDVKNRIDNSSWYTVASLYLIMLKMLHPFMPFITEEIYQSFMGNKSSLMVAKWPDVR
jgi:valyl-tRNA synthetase